MKLFNFNKNIQNKIFFTNQNINYSLKIKKLNIE